MIVPVSGGGGAIGQPIAALITAVNSHLIQTNEHKHRERMANDDRQRRDALRARELWEKAVVETWPLTSPPDWYSEAHEADDYEPLRVFLSVSGMRVSLNQSNRREAAILETARALLDTLYFSGNVGEAIFVSDGWREGKRLGLNTLNTLSDGFAKPFMVLDAYCTEREVTISVGYRPGGRGVPSKRFLYSQPFTLAQLLPQRAMKQGKIIKATLTKLLEEKKASPALVRLMNDSNHDFRTSIQNHEVNEFLTLLEESGISREQVGLGVYSRGLFSDYEDADILGALLCTIGGCLSEADGFARRKTPLKPMDWMSPILARIKDEDVANLAISCCKQAFEELKPRSVEASHERDLLSSKTYQNRREELTAFLSNRRTP